MTSGIPSPDPAPRGGSGEMFDNIAHRYDLLNRVLSLGIDQRWRRRTIQRLELGEAARVLDLATGTGDLALMVAKKHPSAHVVGLDPSAKMLDVARSKVDAKRLEGRIELVQGDAEQLPFEAASFDAVTIAFGIRNVPNRARALSEMRRVLRPGGRAAILELGEPRSGLLGPLARFHVHTIVPRVGAWLSGAREYRYLQQSIAAFPPPEEFLQLMRKSGFSRAEAEPLHFGVCHLYLGDSGATA